MTPGQGVGLRLGADETGTTAVEFAVVAPLLFAILFGIITFGLQFATRIALTYAASEGGRAAVAGLSDDERAALARSAIQSTLTALSPLVDASKASVSISLSADGDNKKVGISIAYADSRFATMPFVPDMNGMAPVTVQYYITDPSG